MEQTGGELIGNLNVRTGRIQGGVIEKELTAALIDEIPVLAVLGAMSEEGLNSSRRIGTAGEGNRPNCDRG